MGVGDVGGGVLLDGTLMHVETIEISVMLNSQLKLKQ